MALQTPLEYYDDEDNFGKYQYIPLSEIVNKIYHESQDDLSIIKGIKRSSVLSLAKDCLRDLNMDVATEELSFEITVPDSLVWPLPQNYVSLEKISLVLRDASTGSFNLYDLDKNYKMNISTGYLQDNDAEILFDNDGGILEADSSNAIAHPYNISDSGSCHLGNNPTKDTSQNIVNGCYSIDERRGIIVFSSNLADKEVVIKYNSDGLEDELSGGVIYVHKHLRKALKDYVYYERLSIIIGVSGLDIRNAKNKYLSTRHKAVMARSDFDLMRISKAVDTANKFM